MTRKLVAVGVVRGSGERVAVVDAGHADAASWALSMAEQGYEVRLEGLGPPFGPEIVLKGLTTEGLAESQRGGLPKPELTR